VKSGMLLSWRRRLANWLRQRLWWFAAGGFLLLAIWVVLARQVLTMVPTWRGDLETLIESRIQTPLEIGSFSGHLSGLSPVFVLEDVHLPGPDPAHPGLTLERVELTVDVLPSMLSRTLRARSLLIRGLDVRLLVDEDGKVRLHGIDAFGSAAQSTVPAHEKLLQLLYRQKRIQIEQVRGTLEMAGAEPLEIAELNLAMVSSGQRHRLAMTARSAAEEILLDLRLDMRGDAYRREQINGRGYVDLALHDAEPWLLHRWPLEIRPEQLRGDVQGWLTIRNGQLQQSALRVRLDGLTLSGSPLQEPWPLTRLSADALLDSAGEGYRLELARLVLADAQDRWQPGAMTLGWNVAGENDWQVALHDVDLAPFSSLLQRLPWQQDHLWLTVSGQLESLRPAGTLRRLSLRGNGRKVDTVSARFADVSLQSDQQRPGVSGLSGWISGDATAGYGRLDSQDLTLRLPAQFDEPLSAAVNGAFRWRHDGEQLEWHSGWLTVTNPDARAQLLAGLRWQREAIPELTLLAALTEGQAANAARYIPARKLPPAAAEWLNQAFVSGTVDLARFLHEGPVVIDPIRQQDRTLQMQYVSDDMTLRFLPDWPLITDLKARVLIDGRHISGRQVSGQLLGSALTNASVDIPSRQDHEVPQLIISGQLNGPASSIATLLHNTPLAKQMPDEVADWQISDGDYQGQLLLNWPLAADAADAVVLAQGRVDGVSLKSAERRLQMSEVAGEFGFDLAKGMQLPAFTGRLFDRPVNGKVETSAGSTRLSWRGSADMVVVRDWLNLDWLAPASGEFDYAGVLTLPWRRSAPVTLLVDSGLEQVVVELPQPFAKQAGRPAALRLELTADETGSDLVLRYQNWLAARLLLDGGDLRAGRIRFGGGAALRPATDGLTIEGRLSTLKLSDWNQYLQSEKAGAGMDWPVVDLEIDNLDLYGFPVSTSRLRGEPQDAGWRLALDAPTLVGTLEIPNGYRARGSQPMVLGVDHAALTRSPGDAQARMNPATIPVMDVQLDALSLDGNDMGRWRFALRPLRNGVSIEQVDALWRNTTIRGKLDWSLLAGTEQSHFIGSLDSKNLARSLRRWELEPFIESDEARAVVDLRWSGDPTELDYLQLQGQASVAIGPGRIPKTDSKTSALRVLGVFNMATVSRRLRLDFSDLYKKGLAFEEISGDFALNGSKVGTNNLQIKSPSAELRLRGEMDMEAETLDHYMEVTLPVSSNLYVGCLAGPAACAGIFVVERLWGERLEKMTSLGYRVTGSWDAPKVEEDQSMLERRSRP
jgi:uncharacterized protein (TIGR02099 family)